MSATDGELSLTFYVPLRLGRGENNREVRGQRIGRIQRERCAVLLSWTQTLRRLSGLGDVGRSLAPCAVTLTRVAPATGKQLDDVNLRGSLKAPQDEVALILGVDDADPRVTWDFNQERGPWGLWVQITATLAGPVVVERPRPPKKPRDLTAALLNHAVATRRAARGERANVGKAARDLLAMAKPAFIAPRRGA